MSLRFAVVAAVAAMVVGHTSRLPGRFEKYDMVAPEEGCDLAFTLRGVEYNLSALQVCACVCVRVCCFMHVRREGG